MAKATDALAQALTILGKAETMWEQRLLADKATKDVPVVLRVSRQIKNRKTGVVSLDETKDETIEVHRFQTAPAVVGCEMGLTMNTGNFESARVSVSISVPCYKEEIEAAYEWSKDFCEARVKAEAAEVAAMKKPSNSPF